MHIIAGKHYKRQLKVPKGKGTRPTFSRLKQSLFNILQNEVEGAVFLDLFAGAGGMALEAISRGADQAVLVESDKLALAAIKENISLLNEEKSCKVIASDAFEALKMLSKKGVVFDIIFADPPYGENEKESLSLEVLKFVDASSLLKRGGHLFLEDAKRASRYDVILTTLELKSQREMGRAILKDFVKL